jgi:ribosomal protein S18 acetylase RimI-like enzyme
MAVEIRLVRPAELPAVDELIVRTYVGGGLVAADSPYVRELAAAAERAAHAEVYVALAGGRLVGSVTFAAGGTRYAAAAAADEAAFRMLAVEPTARGAGVGTALVHRCIERARSIGASCLRLSSFHTMTAAHRLYDHLGFARTAARDYLTPGGVRIVTYALPLPTHEGAGTNSG